MISSSASGAAEADRLGGAAGDPRDLIPGLLDGRRAVDAEHRALALLGPAKPAIIPACVEPVTEQTTIVSKKTPSSASCAGDLARPAREPVAAERVVGGAGRDRVRLAAALAHLASACSQLSRKPMSKPASERRTSAPMIRESRMLPTVS